MSVWIRNLRTSLEDRPVILLHGNVRDKYIDEDGRIYENLTALLAELAVGLPIEFSQTIFYDTVGLERDSSGHPIGPRQQTQTSGDSELDATGESASANQPAQRMTPSRVLATWQQELSATDTNRFAVLFYLDKLVSYKISYGEAESETLLRLEKLIENITPNNRLVMAALQDTLIPIELYISSPKTRVQSIPMPGKNERGAYLKHRLGDDHQHLTLVTDLTDGLFLRDLDNVVREMSSRKDLNERDVRRLVNKYRVGEQEDYFSGLSIERLDTAPRWFKDTGGVKGQDEAIQKVADMLCLARAGLSGTASGVDTKPRGVLFFAGPTGVGKTLVAKKLAYFLFNTEEAFLRFDMSEFKEEHTISKFIGSPPGYVGYERGGMLTNAVRERPFSVVLFDEIEKAHPKIMDIFLQILDEGRLTDSRGQTVFFTEAIIIFTSNLGTRTTDSRGNPVAERDSLDKLLDDEAITSDERKKETRKHFSMAVERFFVSEISRPELLNRIGNNIVPFNCIYESEIQEEIVRSHLRRIKTEVEDKYRAAGHRIVFDDSIATTLVRGYGRHIRLFGARGITNALQEQIIITLARMLLRAEFQRRNGVTFKLGMVPETGMVSVTEN